MLSRLYFVVANPGMLGKTTLFFVSFQQLPWPWPGSGCLVLFGSVRAYQMVPCNIAILQSKGDVKALIAVRMNLDAGSLADPAGVSA